MAELVVSLLGPPRVEVDGRPLRVDTRKAIALLAYLAVEGQAQSRETLAALLWSESDDSGARSALRRTLSSLRTGLGGRWLIVDRQAVSLDGRDAWMDVGRFRELLDRQRGHDPAGAGVCADCAGALAEAVALYRGDLLSGFSLRDSPEFDDWQAQVAEGLRDDLASTLDKLVATHAASGQPDEALAYARRRLALDPLQEATHQVLMRLHARRGDRSAALQQYRECVRVLDEELGVAPLEETTRLYQEILAGHVSPPSSPALAVTEGSLGPAASPSMVAMAFTGRDAELQALLDAYAALDADGRLLTLEGEAGIGKTRLASEFVDRAQRGGGTALRVQCYEGELNLAFAPVIGLLRAGLGLADVSARLAGLPAYDRSEAARLASELLEPGVPPPPLDSPAAQSRFFGGVSNVLAAMVMGGRPGIILVEDLHWADEASIDLLAYLARRLSGRPLCLLLTWREEELPAGHRLRRLAAERQREGDGVHLQLGRLDEASVRRLIESSPIREEVGELSARLFRETEGLPFFIVQYLSDLVEGSEGSALPAGIRALLHSRLSRVNEADLQVLSAAAVIGRSFSFETLRAASARSEDETISATERLTHQGFFRAPTSQESDLSYDFSHDKLRAFVYEETSPLRRRRLHARVAEVLARHTGREQSASAALIGGHYRLAGQDGEAAHYFRLAGERARSLRANSEALAYLQAALESGHPDAIELHEQIGELLTLAGAYYAALASYQTAAAMARSERVQTLEHKIGGLYLRMGAWRLAEEHFSIAAAGSTDGDGGLDARIMADLSLAIHRQDRDDEAAGLAEQALGLAQAGEDGLALAQAHNIAGVLAAGRGDQKVALEHLQLSLESAEQLNDPGPRIAASNNIALVLRSQGNLDAAEALTVAALELCVRQGDRHREAALRNNLADLLRAAGRDEESMAQLKSAVSIFAEIGIDGGSMEPEIWKLVEW